MSTRRSDSGAERRTAALASLADRSLMHLRKNKNSDSPVVSPVPGLALLQHLVPTSAEATIYKPIVCLILQGAKQTTFAGRTLQLRVGECLLISHDLPIVARVLEAPYLALILDVDVGLLRGLYEDAGKAAVPDGRVANALEVCRADAKLLDAFERYLELASSPEDVRVLGPMLLREIHYRLLIAPFGAMLRSLLRYDSHASAITRALALLQRDFRVPIAVAKLARDVGMSVSNFHRQFKAVTLSSPVQYQKELRLLEARRLLTTGSAPVTMVAYDVGYGSPTQFSREYARKFGHPPSRDLPPT